MKTNIIDHAKVSAKIGTKTRPRWPALLLLLLSVALAAGGCTDYYGGYYQAPSRSRLAIGRITLAVLVITWAVPITSGGQDIGDWSTAGESGYTGITL